MDRPAAFFFAPPTSFDKKAVQKHILDVDGLGLLRECRNVLATVDPWNAAIEHALLPVAGEQGIGRVAQPESP